MAPERSDFTAIREAAEALLAVLRGGAGQPEAPRAFGAEVPEPEPVEPEPEGGAEPAEGADAEPEGEPDGAADGEPGEPGEGAEGEGEGEPADADADAEPGEGGEPGGLGEGEPGEGEPGERRAGYGAAASESGEGEAEGAEGVEAEPGLAERLDALAAAMSPAPADADADIRTHRGAVHLDTSAAPVDADIAAEIAALAARAGAACPFPPAALDRHRGGARRGRLDHRAVARCLTTDRVFRSRSARRAADAEVVVLLDLSGSMKVMEYVGGAEEYRSRIGVLRVAAGAIAEVLGRLPGVEARCAGFASASSYFPERFPWPARVEDPRVWPDGVNAAPRVRDEVGTQVRWFSGFDSEAVKATAANDDGEAIRAVAADMLRRPRRQRLIITVTDGAPVETMQASPRGKRWVDVDGFTALREAVEAARANGVECIGTALIDGIAERLTEVYGEEHLVEGSTADPSEAIADIVRRASDILMNR